MEIFYYRVGNVETKNAWLLPNFSSVKKLLKILDSDSELEDFHIFLHGEVLYSWSTWDIKLFLEYDNWETNLDINFLERIMSKIYKYGFDNQLLLDITFCGTHQLGDLYENAESRDFEIPIVNFGDFIKFNQTVKSIDGKSEENFISNYFQTESLTDYLVKYNNSGLKYTDYVIEKYKQEELIFKEGLPIDIFLSLNSIQFEELKKSSTSNGTSYASNTVSTSGFSLIPFTGNLGPIGGLIR